jgi:preprotein translocase subunit SecB
MSEQETAAQESEQQFLMQKIYLKDISFETPNSPEVFMEEWKPEVNVELGSAGKAVGEGVHEVVLSVTVTAKLGDKTAYLAEVHQAGIFTVKGFPEEEAKHMLGSYCLAVLFPYAREAISDLVTKGGFPQLLLAPVNFDALYAQHLQREQQAAAGGDEGEPVH